MLIYSTLLIIIIIIIIIVVVVVVVLVIIIIIILLNCAINISWCPSLTVLTCLGVNFVRAAILTTVRNKYYQSHFPADVCYKL